MSFSFTDSFPVRLKRLSGQFVQVSLDFFLYVFSDFHETQMYLYIHCDDTPIHGVPESKSERNGLKRSIPDLTISERISKIQPVRASFPCKECVLPSLVM